MEPHPEGMDGSTINPTSNLRFNRTDWIFNWMRNFWTPLRGPAQKIAQRENGTFSRCGVFRVPPSGAPKKLKSLWNLNPKTYYFKPTFKQPKTKPNRTKWNNKTWPTKPSHPKSLSRRPSPRNKRPQSNWWCGHWVMWWKERQCLWRLTKYSNWKTPLLKAS